MLPLHKSQMVCSFFESSGTVITIIKKTNVRRLQAIHALTREFLFSSSIFSNIGDEMKELKVFNTILYSVNRVKTFFL